MVVICWVDAGRTLLGIKNLVKTLPNMRNLTEWIRGGSLSLTEVRLEKGGCPRSATQISLL